MSASTIYNHRSLQPTGPPTQGQSQPHSHTRLNEAFDSIRAEFDSALTEANVVRNQKDEIEGKVVQQVNELNIIRQSLYDLEAQHNKVRQQFEDELGRLRSELLTTRQQLAAATSGAGGPPPAGPGISSGPGAPSQIGPGGALVGGPPYPPAGEPPYGRDYARERPIEREPRIGDRSGLGPLGDRGLGLADRERERDRMDRERERERDRERERLDRDRDRIPDGRDTKRSKNDRMKSDRPDHFSPSLGTLGVGPSSGGPTPKLPPPPGPGAYGGPAPPGPADSIIPTHTGPGLHTGPGGPPPLSGPSSGHPTTGPGVGAIGPPASANQGFPDDLDIHTVAPDLKKEGTDWFAIFNPKVKRQLDVSLVHTLMHESVVCCVRFSADGKYLATGCNRTAQIYDTKTGQKTCVLVDEAAGKSGDLYIRSVCFSPDGKFLATGAEDKQIRIWDIGKKRIRNVFDGHQQEIYSLDFSTDGRLIVSGSGDKTARIWDMVDGTSKVLTINDHDSLNNDAGVTSVAISPNGQYVAAGSLDTVVRIWDVATGVLVERLRGHRDSVYSVAFTPDGKGLVSGSLDKTLKYWDVSALGGGGGPSAALVKRAKDGKRDEKGSPCTMNFNGHKDYVLSVAVSHDGQWVVSGSKDRGVQFWDAKNAVVQCMLQGHKNSVISIDLSPAGSILATGSGDWQARIWSYSSV
ncbi:hypothetical protein AGABI2DRAFT_224855 [Agaricus bisporus var. bisporus H97]|uniref:hypothetical protein n=1 Tax=Agaricus bisporus var. bisporus (strain H97 / ATCC MYA-4626 / FGSC 10389) TaxID=936046 RepID=UPI00029F588A|nr:hypothetical protein AGABI2DRAFT_224855 [Agaricus bisporus var. bisporus H97]EKV45047.1 hypothetical protein AGABI2DRAFT_224855 [Agaricus bisporus var. bisporus H97]